MPKKKQSYKDMMAAILKPKDKPVSKTKIAHGNKRKFLRLMYLTKSLITSCIYNLQLSYVTRSNVSYVSTQVLYQ